jgi:hypothetical protein
MIRRRYYQSSQIVPHSPAATKVPFANTMLDVMKIHLYISIAANNTEDSNLHYKCIILM